MSMQLINEKSCRVTTKWRLLGVLPSEAFIPQQSNSHLLSLKSPHTYMKWAKTITAQFLLVDESLFSFFHRFYDFSQWKSNFPEESEHIKMTAVLDSSHSSVNAHDRHKLGTSMYLFDNEFQHHQKKAELTQHQVNT